MACSTLFVSLASGVSYTTHHLTNSIDNDFWIIEPSLDQAIQYETAQHIADAIACIITFRANEITTKLFSI